MNKKRGYICDKKSQIYSLNRQGKGSLLLPCSEMPIGIFLFSLKSDFQKNEKNGEKRRKPEKISGFSVGIFFVKTHWRHHPESDRGIKVLQTSALPLGYGAGE